RMPTDAMKAFSRGTVYSLLIVLLAGAVPAVAAAVTADPELQAGRDYELVNPPQPTADPSKVEVLEFFWYGCPHCYHFEPDLNAWLKKKPDNVVFVRQPA